MALPLLNRAKPFRFLDLPAELRNNVYKLIFSRTRTRIDLGDGYSTYKFDLALFNVNRQIYFESRNIFRQIYVFVRIETPWDEAQQHVAIEGHVPVLATGHIADQFDNYTMSVVIEAPRYGALDRDNRKFVLLADDLAAFCKMWFYSDLSYAGDLNEHLRLALTLRNPHGGDSQEIPEALQAKLLMPFGMVKGLRDVQVQGGHSEQLEEKVREEMKVPYDSPEVCLEEATNLKDAGNVAMQKDPARAIQLYLQAFEKLHIVCTGRRRSIWGDAWFDRRLEGGRYDGEHGQVVRLILRVRLVANVVKAYLDLEDYDEALFWGKRTIQLMRNATGSDEDEPMLSFPAATELGKIFYRTGVATKALGDTSEARRLLRVALGYLPHDKAVMRALDSVALRLG
jgi:tetratricopeptide (TPR) repeat protein